MTKLRSHIQTILDELKHIGCSDIAATCYNSGRRDTLCGIVREMGGPACPEMGRPMAYATEAVMLAAKSVDRRLRELVAA